MIWFDKLTMSGVVRHPVAKPKNLDSSPRIKSGAQNDTDTYTTAALPVIALGALATGWGRGIAQWYFDRTGNDWESTLVALARADALQMQGDFDGALQAYAQAAAHLKNAAHLRTEAERVIVDRQIRLRMAESWVKRAGLHGANPLADLERAVETFQQLQDYRLEETRYTLVVAYREHGRYDKAVELARLILNDAQGQKSRDRARQEVSAVLISAATAIQHDIQQANVIGRVIYGYTMPVSVEESLRDVIRAATLATTHLVEAIWHQILLERPSGPSEYDVWQHIAQIQSGLTGLLKYPGEHPRDVALRQSGITAQSTQLSALVLAANLDPVNDLVWTMLKNVGVTDPRYPFIPVRDVKYRRQILDHYAPTMFEGWWQSLRDVLTPELQKWVSELRMASPAENYDRADHAQSRVMSFYTHLDLQYDRITAAFGRDTPLLVPLLDTMQFILDSMVEMAEFQRMSPADATRIPAARERFSKTLAERAQSSGWHCNADLIVDLSQELGVAPQTVLSALLDNQNPELRAQIERKLGGADATAKFVEYRLPWDRLRFRRGLIADAVNK